MSKTPRETEQYKLGYFNALKWVIKQLADENCDDLHFLGWLLEREIHKRKIKVKKK
jgi:hypothetical protein